MNFLVEFTFPPAIMLPSSIIHDPFFHYKEKDRSKYYIETIDRVETFPTALGYMDNGD